MQEQGLLPPSHRDDFAAALSRILASQAFSKSARLSGFLRHVCLTTLEGREKSLSEQRIGTAVFGRPDHYNPSDDTIVRSTARLLRQRLAQYYEEEGRHESFRIAIPRGAYVPVFVPAAPDAMAILPENTDKIASPTAAANDGAAAAMAGSASTPALAEPAKETSPPAVHDLPQHGRESWRMFRIWVALGSVFVLLAGLLQLRAVVTPAQDASQLFWATMLPADRDTVLAVSDNGLVMYQGDMHREVGLSDYIANRPGEADSPAATLSLAQYGARRYTAMSSVTIAAEVGKLARAAPERFHVRFARDLKLSDLKHGNTILVGVEQSNPWWELYRNQFNFHIDWDRVSGDFIILNDRPAEGEPATYPFTWDDPGKRGYALIGFKRNLSGDGHTLLIGGTTSAGTDAATEFLMNPESMAPLMQKALRPDGSIRKFEVLLQCVLQANGSTDIQLLGMRVRPSTDGSN